MSLHSNAGNPGANPNTGRSFGAQLRNTELNARTQYANPTVPPEKETFNGPSADENYVRSHYNDYGGMPVKYDVPSHQKERMQLRSAIRTAAGEEENTNVIRVDPITDEEVEYLASMKDQAELADFDRYVNSLIDVRKPGNLKWLMEIYPEFVNRRIQQVHTDYEFALRNQMIDSWGINTLDDLHFKYMVDQGKIDGPRLGRHRSLDDNYAPGLLSPWSFVSEREDTLKLPYASAQHGPRPQAGSGRSWRMVDGPLNSGRKTGDMAKSMYSDINGQAGPSHPRPKQEYEVLPRPAAAS